MGKRKALVVGINDYRYLDKLNGCVPDAEVIGDLLKKNYDNRCNFDVKTLFDGDATTKNIYNCINQVFNDQHIEIGLFYFSGHGYDNNNDGGICGADTKDYSSAITFKKIMDIVNSSMCHSKIIILDCCYSGQLGKEQGIIGDVTTLSDNTIILTACSDYEPAVERDGRGVFSLLLQGGLDGGAADILGDVTPGSLYSYIDKALNSWEQRPFFKANVCSFISIRQCKPRVTIEELHKCMDMFLTSDVHYKLNPSYEFTNKRCKGITKIKPYSNDENVEKFKLLQKMNRNGIVDPVDEEFMYFAAMKFKACKLTSLGRHYWKLCKENKI